MRKENKRTSCIRTSRSKYSSEYSKPLKKQIYYIAERKIFNVKPKVKPRMVKYEVLLNIIETHMKGLKPFSSECLEKLIDIVYDAAPEMASDFDINAVSDATFGILKRGYTDLVQAYDLKPAPNPDPLRVLDAINFAPKCCLSVGGNLIGTMKAKYRLNKWQVHEVSPIQTALSFTDGSFDLITCVNTLCYGNLVSELDRVLKRDGVILVQEYDVKAGNDTLYVANKFREKVWGLNVPAKIHPYSFWKNAFIKLGFSRKTYKSTMMGVPMFIAMFKKHHVKEKRRVFRKLADDMPRLKYQSNRIMPSDVVHWGQRKLLLTEIEFITGILCGAPISKPSGLKSSKPSGLKSSTVVYAGAAPGTHVLFLSKLFPQMRFELYDPREFDKCLENNDKITTHVQYFTHETAKQWAGQDVLFISDIRTGDIETMSVDEVEERVKIDHQWQREWYYIMSPIAAMFKFRLPWDDNTTEYMAGDIHIQPYPPITSTETRLIVGKDAPLKTYDNRRYEEQLAYINNVVRVSDFDNALYDSDAMPNNYDSAAELHILSGYLKFSKSLKSGSLPDFDSILELSNAITKSISKHRILKTSVVLKPKKKKIMQALKERNLAPADAKMTYEDYNTYVMPQYAKFAKLLGI